MSKHIKEIKIIKVNSEGQGLNSDILAVEEPLEISLDYQVDLVHVQKKVSVTMRTPGDDEALALGFLFTEGIISNFSQVEGLRSISNNSENDNQILVTLKQGAAPILNNAERNFYTTSSCGVCGKGSIDAIKTVNEYALKEKQILKVKKSILMQLPSRLRLVQSAFEQTGGIHASGLFNEDGELVLLHEDVGRHNALDKLIGAAFKNDLLPLEKHLLLLSGRASFELIQKAAMAGISFVAAIGAPSSLALELAKEFDISLIGFLKEDRFNIYHLGKNIVLE